MLQITCYTTLAALALTASALPQALDLSKVSVKSISYGGSGCPQGSGVAVAQISESKFLAKLPNVTAVIGPNAAVDDSRKNCQINLNLVYPSNLQYAAVSASYVGSTNLDKGVNGVLSTTYYFSGGMWYDQAVAQEVFTGPVKRDYSVTQEVADAALVWAACGQNAALNINSAVSLTSVSSQATGSLTDAGGFELNLKWKKC
ncbi:hypothetical protein B0O99DRAFT_564703 [Bisporella sp. PMI_857]|nr:hypothetical protein B0O99DRAFT_564703 [Bisporella sp. PMI_857]